MRLPPPPTINNLTINTLQNPTGIDEIPAFGWQIVSENRATTQSEYIINIYSDKSKKNLVWTSGNIASNTSQHVKPTGLTLQPCRRYYWSVRIKTNDNRVAESHDNAYFDTGVMGDWCGAQWLRNEKHPENWRNNGQGVQYIEFDMKASLGNIDIVFGAETSQCNFKWQINLDGKNPILQRRVLTWGPPASLGQTIITKLTSASLRAQEHRYKIEINGNTGFIITYIDNIEIDRYKCTGRFPSFGKIGFASDNSCSVIIDNFVYSRLYPGGKKHVYISDDYEKAGASFTRPDIITESGNRKCRFIAGEDGFYTEANTSDSPIFYNRFDINSKIESVKVFTTALGGYTLFINGKRVGHAMEDGSMEYEELSPGWTDFNTRVFYSSYDITEQCICGENTIGAVMNEGYAFGKISASRYKIPFIAFLCKIVIRYSDGREQIIVSDDKWKCADFGPLVSSGIWEGEFYDASRPYPWDVGYDLPSNSTGYSSYDGIIQSAIGRYTKTYSPYSPKSIAVYDGTTSSTANNYGAIKIVAEYAPGKSFKLKKGETAVIDYGQNFAAVPSFVVKGAKGTLMNVRFAEILNDSGDPIRYNDGPKGSLNFRSVRRDWVGKLYYVLSGNAEGESHQCYTSYFGYRYCDITATDDIEIITFNAVPISSSFDVSGAIETDNPLVNGLFNAIKWGQRSNMLSLATDCPQRDERSGWCGDTQVFAITGMYNSPIFELYRKLMQDMRDCQNSDGAFADKAPIGWGTYGNAAWADAGIFVPWSVYMMTGDRRIVEEHYDAMVKYMDYLASNRVAGTNYAGPGLNYGDWLAPVETPSQFVSHACYLRDAELMTKMAQLMSESENDSYSKMATTYARLASDIRGEIQTLYMCDRGLSNPTQTMCVLALSYKMYRDSLQEELIKGQLEKLISDNGFRLNTGFVGTVLLTPTLSLAGMDDMAYNIFLQPKSPSWLFQIINGATTMWENWEGYSTEKGVHPYRENSFNHYAFGSVGEWMYRYMAGIDYMEEYPGFKRFRLYPRPDFRKFVPAGEDRIRRCNADYRSIYGKITSDWVITDEGEYVHTIEIPANTEAEVWFPTEDEATKVYDGDKLLSDMAEVEYLRHDNGHNVYLIQSGKYVLSTQPSASKIEDSIKNVGINIYPNPVIDNVHIETAQHILKVTLINLSGAAVLSLTMPGNDADLGVLPAGMYFMLIETDGGTKIEKIIKK